MLGRYGDLCSSSGGIADIIDLPSRAVFPAIGQEDKIYIAMDTDIAYSFTATEYKPLGNVVFKNTMAEFPVTGEANMTYIDKSTRIMYEWNGTIYEQIGASGGGGLVYFEEQIDNTVVNTDAPVIILTAKDKTYPTDIAISPIGKGAIVADKSTSDLNNPANDVTKRGSYALDLQRVRSSYSQVAMNTHSILLGGARNEATGDCGLITCGWDNAVRDFASTVVNGINNRCDSRNGIILNGEHNVISFAFTPFD